MCMRTVSFSTLDGMGTVPEMVEVVAGHGQPALALTDHGLMSGCIRLYKECRKQDIEPLPGSEFYIVQDTQGEERENRFHLGMVAITGRGYEGLVKLSSLSHAQDHFHRKPLIGMSDLKAFGKEYGEDVVVTSGCFFGLPIQQLLLNGPEVAKRTLIIYRSMFPNLYVELQHHSVHEEDHSDDDIVDTLVQLAGDLSLPVVAGQDAHYCHLDQKIAHDMMKDISYHGKDGDDFKFPGDGFHLSDTEWVYSHYTDDQWDLIEEGHGDILDKAQVRIPELDTYQFSVPDLTGKSLLSADRILEREAKRGLHMRGVDVFDTYEKRMKHELKVISDMGFADYFLLVRGQTNWMKKEGIVFNVRGSANGSLVCWLLGITNVDSVQWELSFDRFLSIDRQKPPDVDIDVESSRRSDIIEHLREDYPTLVQIGTYGHLGFKVDPETGEVKGSLYQQYAAAMRRKEDDFNGAVSHKHREGLLALDKVSVRKSAGTHAAGIVIPGAGLPIEKLIPTMRVGGKNGTVVTQPPMEDVEDAGYVKLDYLGLSMLETISLCCELIGRGRAQYEWIPWDDKKACRLLQSGKTEGVFQFEGGSMKRGSKEMGIHNTNDVILALALFRPALMQGGQTERYLEARKKGTILDCPEPLRRLLEPTLGIPLWQEQVIDIMRIAGLSYDELNAVLKAVKASNDKIGQYALDIMKRTGPIFRKKAIAQGFTKGEAKAAWGMVQEFSEYGFNKSHATSYGHMSYRSAYLKAHYPLEFMCATLNTWAGTPKERQYVQEARRLKFRIVKADVNDSGPGWRIDRTKKDPGLRRGLLSIAGIGAAAATTIAEERQQGEFEDLADFIDRVPARPVTGGKDWAKTGELKGVCKKLAEAGALRSLGVNQP